MLKRFCYYSIRNTTWKQRDKQLTLLKDLSSSVLVNKYFSSYICDPQNCWNCGQKYTTQLFCSNCSSILPLHPQTNYFHIFNLECQTFDIQSKILQKSFTQLQRKLHPDKFTLKSNKEQEISADLSAFVNKAYVTLTKPISKAVYMLKLKGSIRLIKKLLMV